MKNGFADILILSCLFVLATGIGELIVFVGRCALGHDLAVGFYEV